MKVLVTGNLGYIGSVLTDVLAAAGFDVTGLDAGFFKDVRFVERGHEVTQLLKDVRDVEPSDIRGFDAVIHLAALSNDPAGDLNPALTYAINRDASIRLAQLSRKEGVQRFLFSSSCSIYGAHDDKPVAESAPFSPLTPYAVSKVDSEREISRLAAPGFAPVFLRNATVHGVAPKMRFDLVVNNMAGYAFTEGEIKMLSDGTPWRPVIHVRDVCGAFVAALEAPLDTISNQAFNIGSQQENFQIKEIAAIVASVFKVDVVCLNQNPDDKRSYRVDFSRAYKELKFRPKWTVEKSARELKATFEEHGLSPEDFQSDSYMTVKRYKRLLAERQVSPDLRWLHG